MTRTIEHVPLDVILGAENNPKAHDLDTLGRSIGRFGFVEPLILDERTGRLVAGHGRLEELRRRHAEGADPPPGVEIDGGGRWLAPVVRGWSSKDAAEAEGYLLASNRITETGGWDNRLLTDLLAGLDESLRTAAGFSQADLDLLLAEQEARIVGATDAFAEWVSMPSADNQDRLAAHTVTVYFPTDADADRFFDLIDRPKARSLWWPHHDGHAGSSMREQVVAE